MIAPAALAALLSVTTQPGKPLLLRAEGVRLERPAEVVAELRARCARCDWQKKGREAAVLRLTLDGKYAQHLVLARGSGAYRVALGRLEAGGHTMKVELDAGLSCHGVGEVHVDAVRFEPAAAGSAEEQALAHAPYVYLRADTLPQFTDLPLVMWYETDPLPSGRRLRYSVIFSNEDGGTPPDRLMATWGRVTDIEYVYGVELDAQGQVVREEYQGKDHTLPAFAGRREGARPLLWVTTRNNMVGESGETTYRVSPAPVPFDLTGVSREAVMDANPWTYQVSAAEVAREGRVRKGARPGSKRIEDPRRFVYVEACADTANATLAFAVGARRGSGIEWTWSDAGSLKWRIYRSRDNGDNGCFRGAVKLPAGDAPFEGLRFRAFTRPLRDGEAPIPPDSVKATLLGVNRVFRLQRDGTPGPSLMSWGERIGLPPDGEPVQIDRPRPVAHGAADGDGDGPGGLSPAVPAGGF